MTPLIHELDETARRIAERAAAGGESIVLAESCTAGLAANWLSRVPGASQWLCGSLVVYQNATKTAWLNIPAAQLDDADGGAVTRETAAAMCEGALRCTPDAGLAASVTGHLGPDAPPELDGLIYVGVLRRPDGTDSSDIAAAATVTEHRLTPALPEDSPFSTLRLHRQHLAARCLLQAIFNSLAGT